MHLCKHDKEAAQKDNTKEIAPLTKSIKAMNPVLTGADKIQKTDPAIDIDKMNDTNTKKILLRPCLLSSGILSKSVFEKKRNIKMDNYIKLLHSMEKFRWKSFDEVPKQNIYNMNELASDSNAHHQKNHWPI